MRIVEDCEKLVSQILSRAYMRQAAATPVRNPKGRPPTKGVKIPAITTAPQEIADEIVRRVIDGESLESICADKHMPSVPTLWRWRRDDPGLEHRIVQASGVKRYPKASAPTPETNPEMWTPLGIMLARMRELWDDGNADDEGKREAITVAEKAAPYVHPRLSAIDARVTHRDLRDMGEDELLRELALLREQAGMLLPHLDATRIPVTIEHGAGQVQVIEGDPNKGQTGGSGDYQSPDLAP